MPTAGLCRVGYPNHVRSCTKETACRHNPSRAGARGKVTSLVIMKLQVVIRSDRLERPVQYDLLLKRRKERYELAFATAMILVRSSDLFMDRARKHASGHLIGWPELARAVKTGAPLSRRSRMSVANFSLCSCDVYTCAVATRQLGRGMSGRSA